MLLQVLVWVLGEYGTLASAIPGPRALTPQQIMTKLVGLLARQKPSEAVKALLLPALSKLCVQGSCALSPEAEAFVAKCSSSQNVELQQRAYELQALLTAPQAVQQAALPHDASCEEFDEAELSGLRELQFLDWWVAALLCHILWGWPAACCLCAVFWLCLLGVVVAVPGHACYCCLGLCDCSHHRLL